MTNAELAEKIVQEIETILHKEDAYSENGMVSAAHSAQDKYLEDNQSKNMHTMVGIEEAFIFMYPKIEAIILAELSNREMPPEVKALVEEAEWPEPATINTTTYFQGQRKLIKKLVAALLFYCGENAHEPKRSSGAD